MTYVFALDVSIWKRYKLLYEDDFCFSEEEIFHTRADVDNLLQETPSLHETPNIFLNHWIVTREQIETFWQSNHLSKFYGIPWKQKEASFLEAIYFYLKCHINKQSNFKARKILYFTVKNMTRNKLPLRIIVQITSTN